MAPQVDEFDHVAGAFRQIDTGGVSHVEMSDPQGAGRTLHGKGIVAVFVRDAFVNGCSRRNVSRSEFNWRVLRVIDDAGVARQVLARPRHGGVGILMGLLGDSCLDILWDFLSGLGVVAVAVGVLQVILTEQADQGAAQFRSVEDVAELGHLR